MPNPPASASASASAPATATAPVGDAVFQQVELLEEKAKGRVDVIVPKITEALGLTTYSWAELSNYGTLIFLILSGLALFARPDLVNLSVAAMCFYAAAVDRKLLEEKLTYLLIFLACSLFTDLLWIGFCAGVCLCYHIARNLEAATKTSSDTSLSSSPSSSAPTKYDLLT